MPWVIYSWEIVKEHREEVEREENQQRTFIKNTVNSSRKAEGLEMKKPTSRRERESSRGKGRERCCLEKRRHSVVSKKWRNKLERKRREKPQTGT